MNPTVRLAVSTARATSARCVSEPRATYGVMSIEGTEKAIPEASARGFRGRYALAFCA
jgi:hypothetical protein